MGTFLIAPHPPHPPVFVPRPRHPFLHAHIHRVWLLALVVYYETTPVVCWKDWATFGNQIVASDLDTEAGAIKATKFLVGVQFDLSPNTLHTAK